MSESPIVKLRTVEFDRLCNAKKLRTAEKRAQALGMSTSQLEKVRTHKSQPGPKFIHRSLALFEVPYVVLFEGSDADNEQVA